MSDSSTLSPLSGTSTVQSAGSLHAEEKHDGSVDFYLSRLSRDRLILTLVQTQNTMGPQGIITVTSQDMKQGDTILIERPLLRITHRPGQTQQNFDASHALAEAARWHPMVYAELMSLSSVGGNTAQHVFQINCFKLNTNHRLQQAVYSGISRIYHSCLPYAHVSYPNEDNDCQLSLFALTNIPRGGEITISYITLEVWPRFQARQTHLQNCWHFQCCCVLCREPVADRNTRERQWAEISRLQEEVVTFVHDPQTRERTLKLMTEYRRAVEEQMGYQARYDPRIALPLYVDERLRDAYILLQRVREKSDKAARKNGIIPLVTREALVARVLTGCMPTPESTLLKPLKKHFQPQVVERPTRHPGARTLDFVDKA